MPSLELVRSFFHSALASSSTFESINTSKRKKNVQLFSQIGRCLTNTFYKQYYTIFTTYSDTNCVKFCLFKKNLPSPNFISKVLAPKGLNEDQVIRVLESGKQDWSTAALVKKCAGCSFVHILEFYNYSKVKMQCTLAKRCSSCKWFPAQDKLP